MSRHNILFIIFLAQAFIIRSLPAQNKAYGKVTDATTGEPIPFANVFFTNTTFGASSDEQGIYSFSGFPAGKYDLTVSYVGYQIMQIPMEFAGNTTLQQDIHVERQVTMLNEIVVKPDTLNWERNFADFQAQFLGTSRYARETVIQNPRDLHLFFDQRSKTLVAHSKKPIVVDNYSTGYRIYYHLSQFEINEKDGLFAVNGLPQFEQMEAKNKAQTRKWAKARENMYYGSLLHFMRCWLTQRWKEEAFHVSRVYRVPDKTRPADEFLNGRISILGKELEDKGESVVPNNSGSAGSTTDSLSYYRMLLSLPKEVDSVAQENLSGVEFSPSNAKEATTFTGILEIEYKKKEDPAYSDLMRRRGKTIKQSSRLQIRRPLTLFPNGYYEDAREVLLENYWSWSERISTMLPLEYHPKVKK